MGACGRFSWIGSVSGMPNVAQVEEKTNFFTFASIIARGMRFFVVAALLWKFGPPIRDFVEKRLTLVTTAFLVLLVGGVLAVKLL